MAWNAVGIERFRSYAEYKAMSENLTAVQERCNELLLDARDLRVKLAERDATIQRLHAALILSGGTKITLPPPTLDVEALSSLRQPSLPEFNTEAVNDRPEALEADGIPVPSQRAGSVPKSRRFGPGSTKVAV